MHAADAGRSGLKKVMLRTVDTDVVVLAISLFHHLQIDELWISFGEGKNLSFFSIHDICSSLGPVRSAALSAFHAFTG